MARSSLLGRRLAWFGLAILTGCGDGDDSSNKPAGPPLGLAKAPEALTVASLTLKAPVHDVVAFGRYAFALNADQGVQILDLLDAKGPAAISTLATSGKIVSVEHDEERGLAYMIDSVGKLYVVNVLAADDPQVIASIDLGSTLAGARGLTRVRDRIYVVAGSKLQAVTVTEEAAGLKLAQAPAVTLEAEPTHVAAGAGSLYLAYASGSLESWSAPSGGTPSRLGAVDLGGEPRGIVSNGSKVIAVAMGSGLNAVDFDDAAKPVIRQQSRELSDPSRVRLFGRTLVVQLERGWVSSIDVSEMASPRALTTNKEQSPDWVSVVEGNLLFGSGTSASVAGIPPALAGRVHDSVRNEFPTYGLLPIRFSKRIDPASVDGFALSCANQSIAGRAILDGDGMSVRFRPDTALPAGTDCELDLSTLRDLIGLELAAGSEGSRYRFRTAPAAGVPVTNPGSKYPHSLDGRFTDWSSDTGTGSAFEWFDVKNAQGMFTRFYADFDGSRLYILNDWVHSDEKIGPDCYNQFGVWTAGGKEKWTIRAYGDQRMEVRKNGQLVDPKSEQVTGGAYFASSPNRAEPHTIYEISLPAAPGKWGVQLHDPGPTFKCSKLESEPTSVAGSVSGAASAASSTVDPTARPSAPSAPAEPSPAAGATDVSLTPKLGWITGDGWETFTSFRVQLARDAEFSKPVELSAGTEQFVNVPAGALRNATTYYWRVFAENAAGSAQSEAVTFTTVAAATCEPNTADCDKDPQNGCEVSTFADGANCGACGNVCGEGLSCQAGKCVEDPDAGSGGSGGTAGSDGAAGSGGTGVTPACATCLTTNCASAYSACAADTECMAILTCAATCTTWSCIGSCSQAHPTGTTLFSPVSNCFEAECSNACMLPPDASSGGTGGADAGSDASADSGMGGSDAGSYGTCAAGDFVDKIASGPSGIDVTFPGNLDAGPAKYSIPCILISTNGKVGFYGPFATYPMMPGPEAGNPIAAKSSGTGTAFIPFTAPGTYTFYSPTAPSTMYGAIKVQAP